MRETFEDRGHVAKKPKRTERLQVMLSEDEITLIDDFRFQKRIPSRAAAIRELLRRGLSTFARESRRRGDDTRQ
jgi:hypothetical protein